MSVMDLRLFLRRAIQGSYGFSKKTWMHIVHIVCADAGPWKALNIFTMLHGMQTLSSDENSVSLSVKCVHCDKTEERSVQIFYTIRKIIYPSFLRRRMVDGGNPSTWNFQVSPPLCDSWATIKFFKFHIQGLKIYCLICSWQINNRVFAVAVGLAFLKKDCCTYVDYFTEFFDCLSNFINNHYDLCSGKHPSV